MRDGGYTRPVKPQVYRDARAAARCGLGVASGAHALPVSGGGQFTEGVSAARVPLSLG